MSVRQSLSSIDKTNNTAEILAAVEAVKQCGIIGNKNVCIKTDSELLVGAWEKAIKNLATE